jgi:predicted nucleic acid-binding protein
LRVLVDTSVWVDFINGHPSPAAEALASLLEGDDDVCTCGVVAAEVFQGLRQDATRPKFEALFRELSFLETSGIDIHLRAADLFRSLRKQGRTIRSTVDCLIATIADDGGCYLLARDRDLEAIVASGLTQLRPWPLS